MNPDMRGEYGDNGGYSVNTEVGTSQTENIEMYYDIRNENGETYYGLKEEYKNGGYPSAIAINPG